MSHQFHPHADSHSQGQGQPYAPLEPYTQPRPHGQPQDGQPHANAPLEPHAQPQLYAQPQPYTQPAPQTLQIQVAQGPAPFVFDGGAGSYFLVGLGAFLLLVVTFGLAGPWATCMYYRWQSEHTIIGGRRVKFTGSGTSLFAHYIKWWLLTIVTLGIYSFWLVPRMTKWAVEHQRLE